MKSFCHGSTSVTKTMWNQKADWQRKYSLIDADIPTFCGYPVQNSCMGPRGDGRHFMGGVCTNWGTGRWRSVSQAWVLNQ